MTRDDLIARLMWNSGGYSLGNFGSMLMWTLGHNEPDIPSIVAVSGPPFRYTDEELALLVAFSDEVTADYDTRWRVRRGANLVLVDKPDYLRGKWVVKRASWEFGYPWHDSLDAALAWMREKL